MVFDGFKKGLQITINWFLNQKIFLFIKETITLYE